MHVWIISFNTGIYVFHLFQKKTTFFSQQPGPLFSNRTWTWSSRPFQKSWTSKSDWARVESHRAVVGSCRKFQQRKAVGFWGNKKEAPNIAMKKNHWWFRLFRAWGEDDKLSPSYVESKATFISFVRTSPDLKSEWLKTLRVLKVLEENSEAKV